MQFSTINTILFVAALEKFFINGLRAGMVIFLIRNSELSSADVVIKSTTFLALNYSLPLLCGLLLDKFPRIRGSILSMGFAVASISILPLVFPSTPFDLVSASLLTFSGFIKVLTPILLRERILQNDTGKEAQAFTNLYTAFNIGTILGTFVIAVVGESLGWNYSFLLISISVLIITFLLAKKDSLLISALIFFGLTAITWLLLYFPTLSWYFIYLLIFVSIAILHRNFRGELRRLSLFLYIAIIHTVFFAVYEQAATSFIVLSEKAFAHFNTEIPVTLLNALDPALNIALGLAFLLIWRLPVFNDYSERTVTRFAIGFVALIPALWLLRSASAFDNLHTGILLFGLSTFFFVLAEQFIVPAGFAYSATSAKPGMDGAIMGTWYTAISSSEKLAGAIGLALVGNGTTFTELSTSYSIGMNNLILLCAIIFVASAFIAVKIERRRKI